MRVELYIDDFICVGSDESTCNICYLTLIELIESLGLIVNFKKVCAPTQRMAFLGVVIDCSLRTLSLPDEKVCDLKLLLVETEKKRKITKQNLQRVLGKLNWASRVVKGGRTFYEKID